MPTFKSVVEAVGLTVDGAGVVVIVVGIVIATVRQMPQRRQEGVYRAYRHDVGRAILLGLELLVAGDIIRTVAVAPTLESVTVLGVIVAIRTFLSMSLQVELEGRWPWQGGRGVERASTST